MWVCPSGADSSCEGMWRDFPSCETPDRLQRWGVLAVKLLTFTVTAERRLVWIKLVVSVSELSWQQWARSSALWHRKEQHWRLIPLTASLESPQQGSRVLQKRGGCWTVSSTVVVIFLSHGFVVTHTVDQFGSFVYDPLRSFWHCAHRGNEPITVDMWFMWTVEEGKNQNSVW